MKLDRWVVHGNVICGYLFDDPRIHNGTRVITEAVRFIDSVNMEAECLDGKYKLGDPGTFEEHNQELIGVTKPAQMPEINMGMFLSPRG